MKTFMHIPFNRPLVMGGEGEVIVRALEGGLLAGGGAFTLLCEKWLQDYTGSPCVLMTGSCTQALEMAAMLIDIRPGDEVIMPSWTFASTANAFVLRGAIPVFVDIRQDTCNLDEGLIEAAITSKTRAIVPVHYAGVGCDMSTIMSIAAQYNLWVIEDAAQGIMSSFRGAPLGSMGHLGAYSFHATKNYTSGGEGGALLVNAPELIERARIMREKGTNREAFNLGQVDHYEWVDVGSSFAPSELQSAALSVQLSMARKVNERRLQLWRNYFEALSPSCSDGGLQLPTVPEEVDHNAHIFYLLTQNRVARDGLLQNLKQVGVMAHTHYVPLHLSPAGRRFCRFSGSDQKTLRAHESLLRLPIYYSLSDEAQKHVIDAVNSII